MRKREVSRENERREEEKIMRPKRIELCNKNKCKKIKIFLWFNLSGEDKVKEISWPIMAT